MVSEHFDRLTTYVRERYPQFCTGIDESVAVAPARFGQIADMYLEWASRARGPRAIENSVDAFVQFTTDVNLAQARYEASGHYQHQSFAEVYDLHYSQDQQMNGYLWAASELVEIAPGHGGWGVWALHELQRARLRGYDISPASIGIASSVALAAGVNDRASYTEKDALDLAQLDAESADAVICSFLIEHLEQPERLFAVIHHLLRSGGTAYLTGALTAAQIDHIYEFHNESELMQMAEAHGLRVTETLSANPKRLLPNARFVPRSMAMLLTKT